eukprot:scaffold1953_cov176-Amphora_coffeaeformis.AAC.4
MVSGTFQLSLSSSLSSLRRPPPTDDEKRRVVNKRGGFVALGIRFCVDSKPKGRVVDMLCHRHDWDVTELAARCIRGLATTPKACARRDKDDARKHSIPRTACSFTKEKLLILQLARQPNIRRGVPTNNKGCIVCFCEQASPSALVGRLWSVWCCLILMMRV